MCEQASEPNERIQVYGVLYFFNLYVCMLGSLPFFAISREKPIFFVRWLFPSDSEKKKVAFSGVRFLFIFTQDSSNFLLPFGCYEKYASVYKCWGKMFLASSKSNLLKLWIMFAELLVLYHFGIGYGIIYLHRVSWMHAVCLKIVCRLLAFSSRIISIRFQFLW